MSVPTANGRCATAAVRGPPRSALGVRCDTVSGRSSRSSRAVRWPASACS